jgi:hypothetical protein
MNKTINMIFNRFNEYVKNTCTYYFVIYRWYCYTHRHLWRSSDCYERFFRNIISNGGNAWRYIRNRKLKKGRQYKDGMKRDKKTNHTITAHTQLKTEKHETRCSVFLGRYLHLVSCFSVFLGRYLHLVSCFSVFLGRYLHLVSCFSVFLGRYLHLVSCFSVLPQKDRETRN